MTSPAPPGKVPPPQAKGGVSGVPSASDATGSAPRFMTKKLSDCVSPGQAEKKETQAYSVHPKKPGAPHTVKSARSVAVPCSARVAVGK